MMNRLYIYIVAGILFSGMLALTFKLGEASQKVRNEETLRISALEQASDLIEEMQRRYDEEIVVRAENQQLSNELAASQAQLANLTYDLEGNIDALADIHSDFNLSIGAMRLLNDARRGNADAVPTGETVPETSGESSYSDSTPSGIEAGDFISQQIRDAEQYNRMREQCNSLINWVDARTLLSDKD